MTKSLKQTLSVILILSNVFLSIYGQDSLSHVSGYSHAVHFRFDKTDIDPVYMSNRHVLSVLDSIFSDPIPIDSIHIYAYSSPEGREAYNIRLATRRSEVMEEYLTEHYPLLSLHSRIFHLSGGENWDGLRELVTQDENFDERREVLMILDKVKDPTKREELIKRLNGGIAYKYVEKNILPLLRNAMVCTIWKNTKWLHNPCPSFPTFCPTDIPALIIREQYFSANKQSPTTYSDNNIMKDATRYSALKTNFAAWAATTVNLAYETQIGRHFSLDLPLMWSSWDVTGHQGLRIVAFQPELRYWLARPGCGHFFGLHAHTARYNLKWGDTRYQDNETPLLGAGIGYGYSLPFNKAWGMEFNIGAGYAHSSYHLYRNVPNGALFDTRILHYWGITRLGLSLIYKLPQP